MYGIIGLLLLLVAILAIEVYRATEGFTVATPAPTPAPPAPTPAPTATSAPTSAPPATSASAPPAPTPAPTAPAPAATPAPASTIATSTTDALALNIQDRAKFLRDIQDIVRTELLATKQITTANAQPVLSATATAPVATGQIAEQQGRESVTAREKACPKDMSQYIRKDSIPCWNCTLDY